MIIGIDPGFSGGIAFLEPEHPNIYVDSPLPEGGLKVYDLPLCKVNRRKQVDPVALTALIRLNSLPSQRASKTSKAIAVVEDVHSMPNQGVVSTFRFGYSAGILLGVFGALSIETLRVKPSVWKSDLGLSSRKKDSLALAKKIFPSQKQLFLRAKDDGRAEAALIAHYAKMKLFL